ncbi:hypothetical protein EDB80DRAFT_693382 [Ilyonectria destructans]|nr:hypothetical protein EDB80DRAFT_693382 [Ilyonectria destructans]
MQAMENNKVLKLNHDVYPRIANFLGLIDRIWLVRALGSQGSTLPSKYKKYCHAWALIFKKDDWLEAVMELQPGHPLGDPVPLLLGSALSTKWGGKTEINDVALLVNDWSGDCLPLRNLFFDCLQDHVVDKPNGIIRFKDCKIRLHADEILRGQQEISIQNPESLIGFERKKGLFTYVSYYNKGILQKIGPDCIAGIREREGKEKIEELCSVKLQFRGGQTCYRELHSSSKRIEANRLVTVDEQGHPWTNGWSLDEHRGREE